MDTAITWCRDNGWPNDLLSACFFYPAIGSIVYLTDEGGPTAVFNQTPAIFGMEPLVPSEVALIFPKRNRLMIFNGAKYHGVMVLYYRRVIYSLVSASLTLLFTAQETLCSIRIDSVLTTSYIARKLLEGEIRW